MKLVTSQEARHIDELSTKEFGIPADMLMEGAGALAAHEIHHVCLPELKRGRVLILCGPGNNGADGLVVARHLHAFGDVRIQIVRVRESASQKCSPLFISQLERVAQIGLSIEDLTDCHEERLLALLKKSRVVVDALFGTGLNRDLEGIWAKVIGAVNASRQFVVSLDTPSGLDVDRGHTYGACICAQRTLTFGLSKPGFYLEEGPQVTGAVRILPIGFPRVLIRRYARTYSLFTDQQASRLLPFRKQNGHKYTHGKLLVVAGSPGHWGAGVLAARGAYRAGCGHVTWASHTLPQGGFPDAPEILTATLADIQSLKEYSAVVVGPGLGVCPESAQFLQRLTDEARDLPVVLDADALTLLAAVSGPLSRRWCLTPHAGELARLFQVPSAVVAGDRGAYARKAREKFGCTVLVKGFRSIVATPDTSAMWIVGSGNSALAKAGTGDVLSGMIGAFLAQGLSSHHAVCLASFVHGQAADLWLMRGESERSMLATDIELMMSHVLRELDEAGGRL